MGTTALLVFALAAVLAMIAGVTWILWEDASIASAFAQRPGDVRVHLGAHHRPLTGSSPGRTGGARA